MTTSETKNEAIEPLFGNEKIWAFILGIILGVICS